MPNNRYVGNANAILTAAMRKLENYPDDWQLFKVHDDDLLAVINMSEALAIEARSAYLEPPWMADGVYKRNMEKYDEALKKYGIVGRSPEGYFRVLVPPLINRRNIRYGSSYRTFSDLLRPHAHAGTLPEPRGPQLFVYKRYVSKPDDYRCMDNENVDAQNLTNAVCFALFISDRACDASFHYAAVKSRWDKMELTVIPATKVELLPSILAPREPHIYDATGKEIPLK